MTAHRVSPSQQSELWKVFKNWCFLQFLRFVNLSVGVDDGVEDGDGVGVVDPDL